MLTLTPAYNADYKSKKEVTTALKDRKDFIINQIMHPYDGKPCNIQDLPDEDVKVRYNNNRSVMIVNPKEF